MKKNTILIIHYVKNMMGKDRAWSLITIEFRLQYKKNHEPMHSFGTKSLDIRKKAHVFGCVHFFLVPLEKGTGISPLSPDLGVRLRSFAGGVIGGLRGGDPGGVTGSLVCLPVVVFSSLLVRRDEDADDGGFNRDNMLKRAS